ncbi:MAG: hypothetical protein KA746_15195 [Pyrinomonadaceae bacterium]|nr:hypothetical protein [Pyrinomonadaceae bacterium]
MNSEIKFPRRNQDGSFCVIASFAVDTTDPDGLFSRVKAWLIEWAENNQAWVWKYDSGREDTFVFSDDFKGVPTPISCDFKELKIRLEGQPRSQKFWRDWLALRIVPELQAGFVEIENMVGANDCIPLTQNNELLEDDTVGP